MLILRNCKIIDVEMYTVYEGDIFISDGIIVKISRGSGEVFPDAESIDISGSYVSPGFIDSHIHIESSMLAPIEFCRVAAMHGTTGILVDPHEIANVSGRKAVQMFIDIAGIVSADMFIGVPSCVPVSNLEHAGAEIVLKDILELVRNEKVYGLAEMMNFQGIIHGFGGAREKVDAVFNFGKIVDGHCPGIRGKDIASYISNGKNDGVVRISNDHETTDPGEAVEKLDAGMYLALRHGSTSKDLDFILPELIKRKTPLDRCMLCSDDLSPQELHESGHVDRIILKARDILLTHAGISPAEATIHAIAMATVNPSRYISKFLAYHTLPPCGVIAAGARANLVVIDSLEKLCISHVIHHGRVIIRDRIFQEKVPVYDLTAFKKSVNLLRELNADDFHIPCAVNGGDVCVRVIETVPGSLRTKTAVLRLTVSGGLVQPDPERDIAKIAVFERHHATGSRCVAFVRGLGIQRGAIASTVAHDSHNLIVAGIDEASMARAANHLFREGGGMAVAHGSGVVYLPLPVAGLMSDESITNVIAKYRELKNAAKLLGTGIENIFMRMSFLSLPVIPDLKITDRGLVDVGTFSFVGLFPERGSEPALAFNGKRD